MKNKKLLLDIKEYLKYYENQVLEDWYELIRHISVSETGEGIESCCDWICSDGKEPPVGEFAWQTTGCMVPAVMEQPVRYSASLLVYAR